ncbi:PREDICTED: phosphatidylcholine:ceramide cholinephosphotransferase 2-like isoform X2 [Nicrophorus vespilloides]|uniref:Phosphatidylcholine:ceramide cholinephosphotransferase 2-like isoform X2 n=1 Tax=Nicrophorus vespilloides TaxID=110193 RepID=A0ABM1MCQ9_NICVS|nr:PREDICTED: phosphatidylcholine:ceramide cholinephosphotransferase 2-like isoform X2 [Nicrophorus vespilloides]
MGEDSTNNDKNDCEEFEMIDGCPDHLDDDNNNNNRMVLEPKFADYGSIQSIGEAVPDSAPIGRDSLSTVLPLPPAKGGNDSLEDTSGTIAVAAHNTIVNMTQVDLYQRQPLLQGDKWGHASHPPASDGYYIDDDDDDQNILRKSQEPNGIIKINIPPPVREEPKFPQERWKMLVALVIFFFSSLLVLISLATVHERVPDRKTYGPLPDIFYDILGAHDWGLTVSEYLIIVAFNSMIVVIILHKHRFILARRLFLIMSLLYMYRALTMFVTVLPISSTTYYCSPKNNNTSTLEMAKRVLDMLSGMGLSINGKQTYCGDFIYSGHTLTLVISYLFIAEYTPKKLYPVHWLYWLIAVVGVFMLQLSRSHYTIDVILAYYVTTRIFWIFHTMANNVTLKQHSEKNLLARMWWFNCFLYFEGNVGGQVPRQWPDWPFPWPRRFQTKSRDS